MIKANIPIGVIDGMGTWWGLRTGKEGKGNGLGIVVFGGEHADLPLVPDKIQQIARAIVESNISFVLDLSGFSKGQMKKMVAAFLDELYKINRIERHIFIEEADMFAPQRTIGPEDAICQGAVSSFVRRGGNHNLGVSVITQRSAVLSKDVLTQADCLVILRTLAPQDKKAIQLWVEEMTDEEGSKLAKWYDSLKELQNGEAWIWHPEKPEIYRKIQFRERETFHATRENIRDIPASAIHLMDVNDFISKFKAVFEPKPVTRPETKPSFQFPNVEIKPEIMFKDKPQIASKTSWVDEPKPSIPRAQVDNGNTQVIQALPNIQIQQYKPTLTLPVELLDQPSTPMGRVSVVLKNNPNNPGKWTLKRIVEDLQDHGWDASDTQQVIDQFLKWEIFTKGHDGNYLKFHPTRIQITQKTDGLEIG